MPTVNRYMHATPPISSPQHQLTYSLAPHGGPWDQHRQARKPSCSGTAVFKSPATAGRLLHALPEAMDLHLHRCRLLLTLPHYAPRYMSFSLLTSSLPSRFAYY